MSGLAFIVILLSGSFTSCSKGENPENDGDYSNEKKLVRFVDTSGEESYTYTFSYDEKGRLTKAESIQEYRSTNIITNYTYSYEFTWHNDGITTKQKSQPTINGKLAFLVLEHSYRFEIRGDFTDL